MENALIIGASGGIGAALTEALSQTGVAVTGLSRSTHQLDVTDEASITAALSPLSGTYDLIFVATGALEIEGARPERSIKNLTRQAMMDQFALNCVGPSLILKHAIRLLPRDRRAVFATLCDHAAEVELRSEDTRLNSSHPSRSRMPSSA